MDLYYDKKPIVSIPVRICISLPFRGPIPEHLDTELLLCSLISLWVSGVCDLWRGLCPGSNWKTFWIYGELNIGFMGTIYILIWLILFGMIKHGYEKPLPLTLYNPKWFFINTFAYPNSLSISKPNWTIYRGPYLVHVTHGTPVFLRTMTAWAFTSYFMNRWWRLIFGLTLIWRVSWCIWGETGVWVCQMTFGLF